MNIATAVPVSTEQYTSFEDNDDDRLFDSSAGETAFLGETSMLGLGVEDFPAFAWTSPKTISRLACAFSALVAFSCMLSVHGYSNVTALENDVAITMAAFFYTLFILVIGTQQGYYVFFLRIIRVILTSHHI